MKTIYSLQEFRAEVVKLATSVEEDYTETTVSVDNNGVVTFQCYIHKHSSTKGATMEEALDKMREKINPIKKHIDVEIELPEPVVEKEEEVLPFD